MLQELLKAYLWAIKAPLVPCSELAQSLPNAKYVEDLSASVGTLVYIQFAK